MTSRAERGTAELQRLNAALRWADPPCRGDDRFTEDTIPLSYVPRMRTVCARCPIRIRKACGDFAQAADVRVGFWAGRRAAEGERS